MVQGLGVQGSQHPHNGLSLLALSADACAETLGAKARSSFYTCNGVVNRSEVALALPF